MLLFIEGATRPRSEQLIDANRANCSRCFARPHFRELLSAVDFVISKDYPARGEVA